MNSEELKIYTALTHPTSPEDFRITDEGTKLYTIWNGVLVCFEGEGLDSMTPTALYFWYQEQLQQHVRQIWS